MSDKYKGDLQDTLVALQHTAHEGNRLEAAKCLGTLCTCLSDDQLVSLFEVFENISSSCLPIHLPIHLSIHLSIYLYIYISTYLLLLIHIINYLSI